jgi:hypothetical protein
MLLTVQEVHVEPVIFVEYVEHRARDMFLSAAETSCQLGTGPALNILIFVLKP